MKKIITSILISSCVLFISCQEEVQNGKNAVEFAKNLKKMGEDLEKQYKEGNQKMEARKAKGDTMAMHYNDLKAYMPTSISGYSPEGDPKGSINSASGFSYSQLEQQYKNGDKTLKINIIDYNSAAALYTVAAMALKSNLYIENDNELIKSIDLGSKEIGGIQTLKKKTGKASLNLGVGDRFWINIEASEQKDTEFVQKVAKAMKLEELAGK